MIIRNFFVKQILVILVGFYILLGISSYSFAETRAFPYPEEFLRKNAILIFIGKVVEVEKFKKWNRLVPTKALVLESIKGDAKVGTIQNMSPKHPGGRVYFKEEFDQAVIGKVGIFYVGWKIVPSDDVLMKNDILMKYKEIPEKNTRGK